jgi:hypothetical protein
MLRHYCIYTTQLTGSVLADLRRYGADRIEAHLNRTRFWLDVESVPAHALVYIKYSNILSDINHESITPGC